VLSFKSGDWIPRMVSRVEGKMWLIEAPAEIEELDLTLAEDSFSFSVHK
jgi:hypothetical protein